MSNFIESVNPTGCPNCYKNNIKSKRGGFQCLDCGEEWTEEDNNFGRSMLPEDPNEGQAALFRKTKGKEHLND